MFPSYEEIVPTQKLCLCPNRAVERVGWERSFPQRPVEQRETFSYPDICCPESIHPCPYPETALGDGSNSGWTGIQCLKCPFQCKVSQIKCKTSRSQQRNLWKLPSCFPHFSRALHRCGSIFYRHMANRRQNSSFVLYLLQSKGFILRQWRRAAGFCWMMTEWNSLLAGSSSLWGIFIFADEGKYLLPLFPSHFPLSSSGHIPFLFLFFSWGFSESPHFQPAFGQRVTKGLKLLTYM